MPKFNDTTIYGELTVNGIISGDITFNGSDTNYLTTKTEVEGAVKELDTIVKTNADNVASKVNTSDIVDNLTSTDTNKPLSANQGRELKDYVDIVVGDLAAALMAIVGV